MHVNGSGYKVIIDKRPQIPEGVAVDLATGLLYYADYGRETIEVTKLDRSAHKVLISRDLVNPRDIQLHHEKGYVPYVACTKIPLKLQLRIS